MKKYITIFSAVLSLLVVNNVCAEDLNYSVSVEPALNITTSSSKVSLDLNPLTKPFDSQDLNVSVSTNNPYGYKLYVNTNTTNLIEKNDNNLYIETLDSEVSENDFKTSDSTLNKWGYKLNSTNNDNNNYLPFTTNNTLLNYKWTAMENDSTNLTFAAKVDYETKAGSYTLPLNFQATANPNIRYMQNFTNEDCKILASDNSYTVYDLRDENDYQVRYINGNCWMVQNLRYVGDSGSPATQMAMKANTSNIDADKIISYGDLTTGNSYDVARIHNSGNVTNGVWYNYAAASAGTITGSSNSADATYSVCPSGWRLPSYSELDDTTNYKSSFSLVTGGYYSGGGLVHTNTGTWWTGTVGNETSMGELYYVYGNYLAMGHDSRARGFYIRCIRTN